MRKHKYAATVDSHDAGWRAGARAAKSGRVHLDSPNVALDYLASERALRHITRYQKTHRTSREEAMQRWGLYRDGFVDSAECVLSEIRAYRQRVLATLPLLRRDTCETLEMSLN